MPEHKIPHPVNILESFKPMQMKIRREKYLFSQCSNRIYMLDLFLVNIAAYAVIHFSNKFVYWYYFGFMDMNIPVPTLAIWKWKSNLQNSLYEISLET
jgi:hypothetical protein